MIAIVYPQFYGVGGIARYIDSFLENIPYDAPKIIVITGDEHIKPRQYQRVEILHVPFTSSRFNLFLWGLRVRRILGTLYKEGRICWVNFHFPPLIPGLFLSSRIPMVLTAHTTYLGMSGRFYKHRHYQSQWSALSIAIKTRMERCILSKTSKVITLTEQGRQEILSYGYNGPIVVIPNGADTTKFSPDLNVEKDIDVLFSGRIELRKGSRAMVKLCNELVAAKPNIRICIVGYGDDELWVRDQLREFKDNILMTGKVSFKDMALYYNRARTYVSTSYYEGLPGTCLEAMAMRLPVIVWDFLFYDELVVDGRTGFRISPNCFEKMAQKILQLVDDRDKAVEMGREGRDVLTAHFNWPDLSKKILAEYKQ